VLADQAPEALGGFLGATLDHGQATGDLVRVAVTHGVVEIAVVVTAAASVIAATDQSLDDTAERPVDALDTDAIELAPDAVLQFLQLAMRLSNERLGRTADRVVSLTGLHESSTGIVQLLPVRGVVRSLLRDAGSLALQVIQQTWVTGGVPSVLPFLAVGTALCISHLVLLGWLSV
jgi:hypothetical protein